MVYLLRMKKFTEKWGERQMKNKLENYINGMQLFFTSRYEISKAY